MKRSLIFSAGAVALGVVAVLSLGTSGQSETRPVNAPEGATIVSVILPEAFPPQAQMGERAYNAVCASCHGENAAGRVGMGPPFIHPIYQPGHHGDVAFQMAAVQGVRAHHWPYGDMPPQAGLTRTDVGNIVAYVRALQRANGIE